MKHFVDIDEDLSAMVNPLQGTDSRYDFSTGNTYPAIGVPRGLTYWSPQNNDSEGFFFDSRDLKFAGFRATHCPSPWMGDFGHFEITPVCGEAGHTSRSRAGVYRGPTEARPALFRAESQRYGISVSLTASYSCGMMEFEFPSGAGDHCAIVVQTGKGTACTMGSVRASNLPGSPLTVEGRTMSHCGGVHESFACYFVVEIMDADVTGTQLLCDVGVTAGSFITAPRAGAIVRIRPRGVVKVRVGTSFISIEQAALNLRREVGGSTFAAVSDAAKQLWNRWLGRVRVSGGSHADRQTLYSCLYHVGLWPTPMHEIGIDGRLIHFSPHTGKIESGPIFTNNGFWDTHRTVYPLLRLIDPDGYGMIVEGFLAHYREGGWLPKWSSPGYRDCMIGSHSDAVISEAVLGGIQGFSIEEAYEAIRRNAFESVDDHGRFGRRGLNEYIRHGYIPDETMHASLSWTLDNAHCDWCVAQVAHRAGRHEDAANLSKRAQNYRSMWDKHTRFFRPRRRDGGFVELFSEFGWGRAHVEGGPWQFAFAAPHDPEGLAQLYGGVESLIARLELMLATPPRFEVPSNGYEIHEMTEMALARDSSGKSFGQYAHSNQPVHGFLLLPSALGRADWSTRQIERVMRSLYTPNSLPGDEDNGEMSAWYVLMALGHLCVRPGSGQTQVVKPCVFEAARIITDVPETDLKAAR